MMNFMNLYDTITNNSRIQRKSKDALEKNKEKNEKFSFITFNLTKNAFRLKFTHHLFFSFLFHFYSFTEHQKKNKSIYCINKATHKTKELSKFTSIYLSISIYLLISFKSKTKNKILFKIYYYQKQTKSSYKEKYIYLLKIKHKKIKENKIRFEN